VATNEKRKLIVNRIMSFLAGGLLVFAVMSFTVVNTAKSQNTKLTKQLDTSRYEAGRLLADAKMQLEAKDYTKAKESLATLFQNQPGSPETVEGQKLLVTVTKAQTDANAKWNAAMPGVRDKWTSAMAAEMLAKSDETRAQLEKGMNETITQEWEKAKAKVREDWEASKG
jgi:hypothetical protein